MTTQYEYIIVGDTKEFNDCLVTICGKEESFALEVLERIKTNPTDHDKVLMGEMNNFRIKKVKSADCWWNDPVLAN